MTVMEAARAALPTHHSSSVITGKRAAGVTVVVGASAAAFFARQSLAQRLEEADWRRLLEGADWWHRLEAAEWWRRPHHPGEAMNILKLVRDKRAAKRRRPVDRERLQRLYRIQQQEPPRAQPRATYDRFVGPRLTQRRS
jgi:hypothetical protein